MTDGAFTASDFFDPRDLVQVKYEMLRRVSEDDASVSSATAAFGLSRQSYYTIPAEQIIMISPAAANRDPARYGNPGELDISRDASGHLGFGHGIHYCLGAQLARAEAETAIPALLARFPGLSLDTSHENLRWRHTRLIRGLESLPIRW